MSIPNKIVVILGPTASGKTKLGVDLACKFDGEIVSADSRQVYRYMDIGTGKDLKEYKIKDQNLKPCYVPYHLIDVAEPNEEFNLAKYQKMGFEAIDDILKRGKLPIVVGGSGLYLQAIVDNYQLGDTQPDKRLRDELEKLSVDELFSKLKKINSKFADKINESDRKNKRRLIRYVEIMRDKGVRPLEKGRSFSADYNFLLIGIDMDKEELYNRIHYRLMHRLQNEGLTAEVENLHKKRGVSWERLESFGLEYKFISLALQKKMDPQEAIDKLNIASRQFAKRQMTWFKRWEKQGRTINWISEKKEAGDLVKKFIEK